MLVGHTDDTGSSANNAKLSEERAKTVAEIFATAGFKRTQIYYQGAGETLPVSSNADEAGRSRNRRVEIIDLSDDVTFDSYLSDGRRVNTAFYRPVSATTDFAPSKGPEKTASASQNDSSAGKTTNARSQDGILAQVIASTAVSATPGTTASHPAKHTPVRTNAGGPSFIDFGGVPVNGQPVVLALGRAKSTSTFSWLSVAQADETAPLFSCLQDRPRIAYGVKSLHSGELRTKDYLPGVYNSSWVAWVNGHLVALNRVAVLRDGAVPANKPDLEIYSNYQGNAKSKPDFSGKPEVNAYTGERGLLYRVFSAGPVQCIDILIPHSNVKTAIAGNMIYPGKGDYYQTEIQPKLAK